MSSNREYKQAVGQSDAKDAFLHSFEVEKSQLSSLCQVNPAKARSSDPKSVDLWGLGVSLNTRSCVDCRNFSKISSMSWADLKPLSGILYQELYMEISTGKTWPLMMSWKI